MKKSNNLPETEKKSIASKIKASFSSKKFKGGAYATVISVIVIIMVILVNIFVTKLDLKVDVSKEGMYTMTNETKDYLKGVKDDITIYYLAQSGNEDDTITEIINQYSKISDKIKVVYKDPVMYPKFASEYVDNQVTDNSVIVVNNNNKRAKYVDNSDMFKSEMDYTTYQSNVTGIDVEGQITSAIQYVTTEDLPVMYMVEGHGETAISATLASSMAKTNVTTNTISTLTQKSIPKDCSILLINAPQKDYSEDEVKMIKDYLAGGGDAIILVDYGAEKLKNFNTLINYYGIRLVDGIVLEGSQGYYVGQYIDNLVPTLNSHDITASLKEGKTSVVAPTAVGIQVLDSVRSTTKIEPLMTTSDSSYSKVDVNSKNVQKEAGDIAGPFSLGVAITENYDNVETKLVVFGSSNMISEQYVSYDSIGNLDLFINAVNFISSQKNTLAIRTRSIGPTMLSINAAQANFWAAVVVIILPVLILIVGGYICIKRRKR